MDSDFDFDFDSIFNGLFSGMSGAPGSWSPAELPWIAFNSFNDWTILEFARGRLGFFLAGFLRTRPFPYRT